VGIVALGYCQSGTAGTNSGRLIRRRRKLLHPGHPPGSREPTFGPSPKGVVIFDASGHYALLVTRSGQPKFASKNRAEGTAEENKAVVNGSISHAGRYTVNKADKTITFHIEVSTFPNWEGVEQKRPFTLNGDELKYTVPAASGGGTAQVVLKRAN
jgi:hypothetical protein